MENINNKLVILMKGLCLLVVLVSSIVLFGWLTKTDSFLRLNPTMTPMQFNTALCFLLSVSGLLLMSYQQVKYLKVIACIIGAISTISLFEYLLGTNIGIDELFAEHYLQTDLVTHPGRMAPNTALCFMLTALFLFCYQMTSKRFLEINRTVACLIIGVSSVALLGYLFGMPTAYGWNNFTGMALSTSISFLIIGAVILIALSAKSNDPSHYSTPLLVLIIFITAILWQAITAAYEPTDFKSIAPNFILFSGMFCSLTLIYFSYFKKTNLNTHFGQYIALVILSLGTISSIALYSYLTNSETIRMEDKLQNNAESHINSIQSTLDTLTSMFNNVRVVSYYNKNEHEAVFDTISSLFIDKYPSITRIFYVPIIQDRAEFESRLEQHYDYKIGISDLINNKKVESKGYDIYAPVMYQYPTSQLHNDIGLNLLSLNIYREAMSEAYNDNLISHRLFSETVSEELPLQGVVLAPIRKSVYQKDYQIEKITDIRGFLILEYNFEAMINRIIAQSLTPRGLHLYFEDVNSTHFSMFHQSRLTNNKNITFDDLKNSSPVKLPLNFADDQLMVSIWPSDVFIEQYDSFTPEILAIILFLSSLIISAYQYRTTQRELKIIQIKAYLTAVVDSLPTPVLIQDENLIYTECNEEFASLFGFTKEDLSSKEFFTAIAKLPDYSQVRLEDELCMLTGEGKRSDLTIPLENGQVRTYSYLRNVVQINDGKRLIGTLNDLTSEKKISEDLNDALINSNEMFNSAPDAMLITNESGQITQINSAAERLFSYTPEELNGQPIEVLVPEAIRTKHVNFRNAFIKENISRPMGTGMSLLAVNKHGKEISVEVSLSPIKTSEGLQVVVSIRDVSERKAYENAIKEAQTDAEQANRSKSDFLANMSHEIRTPMNAIKGFSHLMLDSDLNEEQEKYVNKIRTSANSLLGIINDILDFSKIEARKLEIEVIPFNLYVDVLENISNIISLKAGEKELELLFDFDTDLPANLIGDPLRVGQVLLNLLNNAVKFTQHGEVSLSIKALQQTDDKVTLRFNVKDSGIGMSDEQIETLFIPFTQADSSTTRNYGGTGLGLSICNKLVDMMGGKIGVNSIEQQGSSFWFELDFAIDLDIQEEDDNHFSDQHLNVLIVDDNPSSLMIIQSYIESFGFNAEIENSAKKALAKLALNQKHYDLIITDWKMPEMDGLEFVKQIQQGDMSQAPQVIMVSAFDRDTITGHSHDVTLSDIMTKPITPSSLLDSIATVLGGKRIVKSNQIQNTSKFDLTGISILLAEDNETNQELAKELLSKVGAKVTIAVNGEEAIKQLNISSFDVVLMDIQMPILDGISATKLLRENPKFKDLPIIAMTANALIGDRDLSISAGMNDHINKPIDVKELYSTVLKWSEKEVKSSAPESSNAIASNLQQQIVSSFELAGLNTVQALGRLNHDNKLYISITQKFAEKTADDLQILTDIAAKPIPDLSKEDLATIAMQIHSFKGILGSIGANELVKQCLEIEADLKNTVPPALLGLFVQQISSLINTLNDALAMTVKGGRLDSGTTVSGTMQISHEQITSMFNELEQLLYNNDTDAIELLQTLINGNVTSSRELTAVLESCEQYDFEQAMTLFNGLKQQFLKEQ